MTQSDTGTTLVKLRKMIESMQKEEMRQIQSTHSDALAQIVSIAKQNQLNAEHIAFALSVKELAFPQFSRHSIMSKLDWSGRNEENKIYG